MIRNFGTYQEPPTPNIFRHPSPIITVLFFFNPCMCVQPQSDKHKQADKTFHPPSDESSSFHVKAKGSRRERVRDGHRDQWKCFYAVFVSILCIISKQSAVITGPNWRQLGRRNVYAWKGESGTKARRGRKKGLSFPRFFIFRTCASHSCLSPFLFFQSLSLRLPRSDKKNLLSFVMDLLEGKKDMRQFASRSSQCHERTLSMTAKMSSIDAQKQFYEPCLSLFSGRVDSSEQKRLFRPMKICVCSPSLSSIRSTGWCPITLVHVNSVLKSHNTLLFCEGRHVRVLVPAWPSLC